jgi:two-component system nitrate/nitrite response regulator NarL
MGDQTQINLTMLTDRQHQVAILVCDGLPNKMIVRKLGLSEGTVKIHLHAIYKRLDVRSRLDLFHRFGRSQQVTRLNG